MERKRIRRYWTRTQVINLLTLLGISVITAGVAALFNRGNTGGATVTVRNLIAFVVSSLIAGILVSLLALWGQRWRGFDRFFNVLATVLALGGLVVTFLARSTDLFSPNAARDAQIASFLAILAAFGIAAGKLLALVAIPAVFFVLNQVASRFAGDWWEVHRPEWWKQSLARQRAAVEAKRGRGREDPENPPPPAV